MRLTAGTTTYTIPLSNSYKLDRGYPLIITENETTIVECPAFDEYGQGQTFELALQDLGSSVFGFWDTLKRKQKKSARLSTNLERVLNEMNNHIKPQALKPKFHA